MNHSQQKTRRRRRRGRRRRGHGGGGGRGGRNDNGCQSYSNRPYPRNDFLGVGPGYRNMSEQQGGDTRGMQQGGGWHVQQQGGGDMRQQGGGWHVQQQQQGWHLGQPTAPMLPTAPIPQPQPTLLQALLSSTGNNTSTSGLKTLDSVKTSLDPTHEPTVLASFVLNKLDVVVERCLVHETCEFRLFVAPSKQKYRPVDRAPDKDRFATTLDSGYPYVYLKLEVLEHGRLIGYSEYKIEAVSEATISSLLSTLQAMQGGGGQGAGTLANMTQTAETKEDDAERLAGLYGVLRGGSNPIVMRLVNVALRLRDLPTFRSWPEPWCEGCTPDEYCPAQCDWASVTVLNE